MTSKSDKKKAKRKPLRVLYVELYDQAEVDAVDAVTVRAGTATGRPVTVSEVARALYLDAARRKAAVVVR